MGCYRPPVEAASITTPHGAPPPAVAANWSFKLFIAHPLARIKSSQSSSERRPHGAFRLVLLLWNLGGFRCGNLCSSHRLAYTDAVFFSAHGLLPKHPTSQPIYPNFSSFTTGIIINIFTTVDSRLAEDSFIFSFTVLFVPIELASHAAPHQPPQIYKKYNKIVKKGTIFYCQIDSRRFFIVVLFSSFHLRLWICIPYNLLVSPLFYFITFPNFWKSQSSQTLKSF